MVDQLVVPDTAVKYILFQRTQYLRLPQTRLYRRIERVVPFSIYNHAVAIEAAFSGTRIKALYREDMRREYLSIRPFLPHKCSSVLDIGCGVAGIDFFIYQHYRETPVQLYLLDKTRVESYVYYLFEEKAAFYNSLDVAKTLLTDSGVDSNSIHLIEASDNNGIGIKHQVSVVVSLLSWGFHYPVATYLDRVYDILTDDGVLILDVRKGTVGREAIGKRFHDTTTIMEAEKFLRIAAKK